MFSVIIPVYNGERYIDAAIRSVLAQSERAWELIVVNDGSTDGTAKRLAAYRDDARIRVITQENQGVSAARNRGVKAAQGDYLAFLDADDYWYENHLAVLKGLIQKYPTAGFYGTFAALALRNGKTVTACAYFQGKEPELCLDDFFGEYVRDKRVKLFALSTSCVTRAAFEKAGGFPVGCGMGEDLELTLRVAAYYPAALTGVCTAVYQAMNSAASKDSAFDPDWPFFETVEQLYRDGEIPRAKRENLKKLMAWFTMRRCRHYLIDGRKKKAWQAFRATDRHAVSRKDLGINFILLCLPCGLTKRIFSIRWRGKA